MTNRGMKVGASTITRVIEEEGPLLDPAELYPDYRPELLADLPWLKPRFLTRDGKQLTMTMQGFVIRSGGKIIIVDTCVGDCKKRNRAVFDNKRWGWLDRLKAETGVDPADVDIVLSTHFHVDHVGWNTYLAADGTWQPTFPNARYLFTEPEIAFWRGEKGQGMLLRAGDYVADSVLPIIDAGLADFVAMDTRLTADVVMIPTPGHSPGHVCVAVGHGAERVIVAGDVIHTVLQCRWPQWSTRFCVDPDASRTMRMSFMAEHAAAGTLLAPAHFPSPTWGRLVTEGDHYRFVFLGEN